MRSSRNAPTVLGLVILALSAAAAPTQHISDPLCGTTVVQDLVLDRDVVCQNSSGLTVAAEGLTIDLNGKTIQCRNGLSVGCPGGRYIGIDASRVRTVAIKGPGHITGFAIQFAAAVNAKSAAAPQQAGRASSRTAKNN